jgi:hypothetical protein
MSSINSDDDKFREYLHGELIKLDVAKLYSFEKFDNKLTSKYRKDGKYLAIAEF